MRALKLLLAVLGIVLLFWGCNGENQNVVAPEPSPTPTPDACIPLRLDITATTKAGPGATAWGLGQVATLSASIVWVSDDPVATADCPQLNSVQWHILHHGDPLCDLFGNIDAKTTRLVCTSSGIGLVEAVASGFEDLNGVFRFKVIPPES